jgi:uncharacterized protein DUF5994
MTSASPMNDHHSAEAIAPPEQSVRLELKPEATTATGFVDGGWWPRSRDLSVELPALVAALADRLGQVERVGYRLSEWDPAAHRIVVDGALVHLDGYRMRSIATVDLVSRTRRLTLLVVPPDTGEDSARRALGAAGHPDNADSVTALLDPPAVPSGAR